jgi:tRNA modification GTPase
LHDVSQWHDERVRQADTDLLGRLPSRLPVLHVWNKIDIASQADLPATEHDLRLSAKTHEGLDRLREELIALAGWQPAGEGLLMARQRHVHALQVVADHLQLADGFLQIEAMQLDLLAEELRLAQVALGEITGVMTADDLLGEIFSSFCIGK